MNVDNIHGEIASAFNEVLPFRLMGPIRIWQFYSQEKNVRLMEEGAPLHCLLPHYRSMRRALIKAWLIRDHCFCYSNVRHACKPKRAPSSVSLMLK